MTRTWLGRLGAVLLVTVTTTLGTASAAAPGPAEPAGSPQGLRESTVTVIDFRLDTEMLVRGWVLCASQAAADAIVSARAGGIAPALKAYDRLREAKSCGRFAELRVILRRPLYQSGSEIDRDVRVFGASVNLGGNWASGFLIYGGVPVE
ncbi:MAG: hypothetical protein WD036_07875 [Bauldia sp.]